MSPEQLEPSPHSSGRPPMPASSPPPVAAPMLASPLGSVFRPEGDEASLHPSFSTPGQAGAVFNRPPRQGPMMVMNGSAEEAPLSTGIERQGLIPMSALLAKVSSSVSVPPSSQYQQQLQRPSAGGSSFFESRTEMTSTNLFIPSFESPSRSSMSPNSDVQGTRYTPSPDAGHLNAHMLNWHAINSGNRLAPSAWPMGAVPPWTIAQHSERFVEQQEHYQADFLLRHQQGTLKQELQQPAHRQKHLLYTETQANQQQDRRHMPEQGQNVHVQERYPKAHVGDVPASVENGHSSAYGTDSQPVESIGDALPRLDKNHVAAEEKEAKGKEEEEATVCVCGSTKNRGFMIYCETCRTWQHGKCIGYKRESEVPEEYYCTRCRPDLMLATCVAHPHFKPSQRGSGSLRDANVTEAERACLAEVKSAQIRKLIRGGMKLDRSDRVETLRRYAKDWRTVYRYRAEEDALRADFLKAMRILTGWDVEAILEQLNSTTSSSDHPTKSGPVSPFASPSVTGRVMSLSPRQSSLSSDAGHGNGTTSLDLGLNNRSGGEDSNARSGGGQQHREKERVSNGRKRKTETANTVPKIDYKDGVYFKDGMLVDPNAMTRDERKMYQLALQFQRMEERSKRNKRGGGGSHSETTSSPRADPKEVQGTRRGSPSPKSIQQSRQRSPCVSKKPSPGTAGGAGGTPRALTKTATDAIGTQRKSNVANVTTSAASAADASITPRTPGRKSNGERSTGFPAALAPTSPDIGTSSLPLLSPEDRKRLLIPLKAPGPSIIGSSLFAPSSESGTGTVEDIGTKKYRILNGTQFCSKERCGEGDHHNIIVREAYNDLREASCAPEMFDSDLAVSVLPRKRLLLEKWASVSTALPEAEGRDRPGDFVRSDASSRCGGSEGERVEKRDGAIQFVDTGFNTLSSPVAVTKTGMEWKKIGADVLDKDEAIKDERVEINGTAAVGDEEESASRVPSFLLHASMACSEGGRDDAPSQASAFISLAKDGQGNISARACSRPAHNAVDKAPESSINNSPSFPASSPIMRKSSGDSAGSVLPRKRKLVVSDDEDDDIHKDQSATGEPLLTKKLQKQEAVAEGRAEVEVGRDKNDNNVRDFIIPKVEPHAVKPSSEDVNVETAQSKTPKASPRIATLSFGSNTGASGAGGVSGSANGGIVIGASLPAGSPVLSLSFGGMTKTRGGSPGGLGPMSLWGQQQGHQESADVPAFGRLNSGTTGSSVAGSRPIVGLPAFGETGAPKLSFSFGAGLAESGILPTAAARQNEVESAQPISLAERDDDKYEKAPAVIPASTENELRGAGAGLDEECAEEKNKERGRADQGAAACSIVDPKEVGGMENAPSVVPQNSEKDTSGHVAVTVDSKEDGTAMGSLKGVQSDEADRAVSIAVLPESSWQIPCAKSPSATEASEEKLSLRDVRTTASGGSPFPPGQQIGDHSTVGSFPLKTWPSSGNASRGGHGSSGNTGGNGHHRGALTRDNKWNGACSGVADSRGVTAGHGWNGGRHDHQSQRACDGKSSPYFRKDSGGNSVGSVAGFEHGSQIPASASLLQSHRQKSDSGDRPKKVNSEALQAWRLYRQQNGWG
ncbi:putative histone deacetylase complex subunit cti6 [Porphyridium purpureum]|uniref:Putative histone deacetylase complex subunit cti6 n=1 Tax=Porphyridium purpureum TaxID=35688 RepID=A0A5J4Z4R4_PORPP|nr:putative histone deacetylase complex subunit cti6 [Porphyridium purpureum]|eukprot:POR6017..scf295_1